MCELCGCNQYIKQGKESVLKRTVEIVKELGITVQNTDDYEETEIISRFIASFGAIEDEVYQTAAWVSYLHIGTRQLGLDERYQAHVRAFQDIFSHLPAQGEPRYIATTYHQLEQLGKELDDSDLAVLSPETRETVEAVNQVHQGLPKKEARLRQRYGL